LTFGDLPGDPSSNITVGWGRTHVALLIEQGAHPQLIASRLGHTSVRTVLDVYGHLFEGLDRNLADSLHDPSEGSPAYYLPTSDQKRVVDFPTK
jgi:hypothetical protein